MKIFITLDYELFFGKSGSVDKCILEPTERFLELCERHGAKCIFFVDAGYLLQLESHQATFPELKKDYQNVSAQIKKLFDLGHDIQLHVHPHWEDTVYENGTWRFDLSRYRLDRFNEEELTNLFQRYQQALTRVTHCRPVAFRAGGWCIQPFWKIKEAFNKCNIQLDSTIFYQGKNDSPVQGYDFSTAKDLDRWTFEDDPCIPNDNGSFHQYPIASYRVSPFFFWKFAAVKVLRLNQHQTFGDGRPSVQLKSHYLKLLTRPTYSVVSLDGYKSSYLKRAFDKHEKARKQNFVIIGHPKAFTPYSLQKFDEFLEQKKGSHEFCTFDQELCYNTF